MARSVKHKSFISNFSGLSVSFIAIIVITIALGLAFQGLKSFQDTRSRATGSLPCVFASSPGATPAFCDSFDQPMGIGDRGGDINGTVWGTSRFTGNENWDSGDADLWATNEQMTACGQTTSVQPDHDIKICNGQLNETTDDNGTVTSLANVSKTTI